MRVGLLCILLVGCGATGQDWVEEPLTAADHDAQFTHAAVDMPEPADPPRPRIRRTVTLGQIDAASSERSTVASANGAATVIVNVHTQNYVTTTPFPVLNYGYGVVPAASAPRANPAPRGASVEPGTDWPAVQNHGPSFPWKSGTSAPWERTR